MSALGLLQGGCLTVLAVLLLAAAWQDLRSFRITNDLSVVIVVIFVVWACAGMARDLATPANVAASVAVAVGVLVVGTVLFAAGALGGGDVKLLSATSLFAGPALLPDLLFVMALSGGAMAVAMLAVAGARLRSHVPYGPAIAAGGLWVAASLALS